MPNAPGKGHPCHRPPISCSTRTAAPWPTSTAWCALCRPTAGTVPPRAPSGRCATIVEHLVTEQLWVHRRYWPGRTIAEVGDRFAGDPLGADPVAAWRAGAETARLAWLEPGVLDRSVHLSYGTDSAVNYGWQMILDLAVHAWDLSVGSSGDRADDPAGDPYRIPDDLAEVLFAIFAPLIPQWREFGIFDPPVPVPADADPHTRLLGLLGRKP